MNSYLITIVFINGDTVKRTIVMKPRRLRKALRQIIKGTNVLFGGEQETYILFGSQISRVLIVPKK